MKQGVFHMFKMHGEMKTHLEEKHAGVSGAILPLVAVMSITTTNTS